LDRLVVGALIRHGMGKAIDSQSRHLTIPFKDAATAQPELLVK
jgi:hypothetical protein